MVVHSRIAWSHSGLLAFIDTNKKVFVTWLRCVDGSHWEYVTAVPVPVPSEGKPIHLSWSASNFDLAIADDLGRLHIISIGVSGTPTSQIIASAVRDQRSRPAELDRLVGLQWLRTPKNTEMQAISTVGNDIQSRDLEPISPMKPFVPVKSRSLLAAVNGNGVLRLLVQNPEFRYTEVDEMIPGATFISHAAFVQLSLESLLVIVVTGDDELVIYEANLVMTDLVKVSVHELASLPLEKQGEELLTLVATQNTPATNTGAPNTVQQNNNGRSLIIKAVYPSCVVNYTLTETSELLHHSFFELFNASDPVPPEPFKLWKFTGTGTFTHFPVQLKHYIPVDNMVVQVFSDGNIKSECIVEKSGSLTMQLDKVGLHFDKTEIIKADCLCISPNGCCVALLVPNDVKLVGVTVQAKISAEEANTIALALAARFAHTIKNFSESCDDLIKVCYDVLHNPHLAEHSALIFNTLAAETQQKLLVNLSAPEDQSMTERLMMIPSPFQRWLSFLSSLGTSQNWVKTPGSNISYTLMHLHLLAFNVTWTMRRITQKSRAQSVEQFRLEIQASQYHLTIMFGPIRWATDLIVRICQEFYSAAKSPSPIEYLMASPNVYGALLMSSISRYLLRYFLRGVRTLTTAAKNLSEQENRINAKISATAQASKDTNVMSEARARLSLPSNYSATRAYKKLATQLQFLPVKLDAFEKFILMLEEKYKVLVTGTQMTEETRASYDAEFVRSAHIPKRYTPLVKVGLDLFKQLLLPLTDIPSLYFYDTTWLGLDSVDCDDDIDGIRKRVILPQESTQVCTRCNIKSIYGPDTGKQTSHWLSVFQRYCVCGGSWLRTQESSSPLQ